MMDDEFLDGCDVIAEADPMPDEDGEVYPLFAEALDPNNPKTVEEAEREWRELFDAND